MIKDKNLAEVGYEARQDYYKSCEITRWYRTPFKELAPWIRKGEEAGIEAISCLLLARTEKAEAESKELGAFKEYARHLTIAITNMVGGGSENFGKRIGDFYCADIPYCMGRLRDRRDKLHKLAIESLSRAKKAEAEREDVLATLKDVRKALFEGHNDSALACTLWALSPCETLQDFIDSAIDRAALQQKEASDV